MADVLPFAATRIRSAVAGAPPDGGETVDASWYVRRLAEAYESSAQHARNAATALQLVVDMFDRGGVTMANRAEVETAIRSAQADEETSRANAADLRACLADAPLGA